MLHESDQINQSRKRRKKILYEYIGPSRETITRITEWPVIVEISKKAHKTLHVNEHARSFSYGAVSETQHTMNETKHCNFVTIPK